ncbi:MAG: 1-acyl-sn-glycerol-3-phosphate acyltransferase [Deltaproteobacteria bacterium]|nr:1-acyl-sn-glycerol-3-phosphate acyltransferase [Deltaproteobacteria bacterium]
MLSEFKKKIRLWIDKVLNEPDNYFLCYLPENIGSFASYILNTFYRGIKTNKEETNSLKRLSRDSIVIYTVKYKNFFEYLFLYTKYKKEKLPVPTLAFGFKIFLWQPASKIFKTFIAASHYFYKNLSFKNPYKSGYIKESILKNNTGLFPLIEKQWFNNKFVKEQTCPVTYLINIQRQTDKTIYIVPHLTFFSKNPHKSHYKLIDALFGSEEKPGIIRRTITLFKNPGKIFMEISAPFNLKEFLNKPENINKQTRELTHNIRTILIKQINRHRQGVTGPIIKSYEEIKQNILTKASLMNYMKDKTGSGKKPVSSIYKKAGAYLDEIASKHNFAVIRLVMPILKFILNLMFEEFKADPAQIAKLKEMSKKGPIIFIPCHKSHIDYMVLYFTIYLNRLYLPHIAAGKNMSFWPFGALFRRGGAFFIRRTFKGAALYSKVFEEYVYNLLEEGGNIEVFIEGTRSRTGKLLKPKLGFMNMLLNAYAKGACDDLIFAPVSIGYDRVIEEKEYIKEMEGAEKKPETIKQIIGARKILKKKYGKIYMKFPEPISLNEFLRESGSNIKNTNTKQRDTLCKTISYKILNSIDESSVITPQALVASAILNHSQEVLTYKTITDHIQSYCNYLNLFNASLADTLTKDYRNSIKNSLTSYENRKLIEKPPDKNISEYTVNTEKRQILDYYRNNCTYFFIPAAYTATAILLCDDFTFFAANLEKTYLVLKEFLKNEFTYDQKKAPRYFIEKTIAAFVKEKIITASNTNKDEYRVSPSGITKLKHYASFIKKFFESYLIVLLFLKNHNNKNYSTKVLLKKIQTFGNNQYKTKKIKLPEALSVINYKNALDYFAYHGINKINADKDKILIHQQKITTFIEAVTK